MQSREIAGDLIVLPLIQSSSRLETNSRSRHIWIISGRIAEITVTDWTDERYTLYLLLANSKALKTDLTADELEVLSKLVVQLKGE